MGFMLTSCGDSLKESVIKDVDAYFTKAEQTLASIETSEEFVDFALTMNDRSDLMDQLNESYGDRTISDEDWNAIESYIPSNSRSQLIDTGRNIVILDAYNANASSMNAALDNFASTSFPNKVLVLGDMLELGKFSAEAHSQILAKARKITSEIYLVGASEFKAVAKEGDLVFDTSLQLKEYFRKLQPEGKTILIKGSNATRLPLIMEVL